MDVNNKYCTVCGYCGVVVDCGNMSGEIVYADAVPRGLICTSLSSFSDGAQSKADVTLMCHVLAVFTKNVTQRNCHTRVMFVYEFVTSLSSQLMRYAGV